MKNKNYFENASKRKRHLKEFGIMAIIDFKAMEIACGNFINRKDEENCSLLTYSDKNHYKKYKN